MRLPYDLSNILYQVLKGSELDTALTGTVYKQVRPNGSKLEDLVINPLAIDARQFQRGRAIANLYVPNLDVTLQGQPQQVPDMARLKELGDIAVTVLQEYHSQEYSYWLHEPKDMHDEATGDYFLQLTIDFRFNQTSL
ncbi:hypothetical protein GCM10027592_29540 [Spirosoma flavus]